MSTPVPIEHWPARLEALMQERCMVFRRAFVIRETASTQDAAREFNARAGDVVVAGRQTAGRGRLGRAWADTLDDGLAVTLVCESEAPQRLSVAAAIGVACGIEPLLSRPVGIKWPNDIICDGRKLGGILIEQAVGGGGLAYVGIGINVSQVNWPEPLRRRAVSLHQLGAPLDRLTVLEASLPSVEQALQMTDEALRARFADRDVLRGQVATLRCGEQIITGRVAAIDPMRGLLIEGPDGAVHLPALTTTVLEWTPAAIGIRNAVSAG